MRTAPICGKRNVAVGLMKSRSWCYHTKQSQQRLQTIAAAVSINTQLSNPPPRTIMALIPNHHKRSVAIQFPDLFPDGSSVSLAGSLFSSCSIDEDNDQSPAHSPLYSLNIFLDFSHSPCVNDHNLKCNFQNFIFWSIL